MQAKVKRVCFVIGCWFFDPSDREELEVWFDLNEDKCVSSTDVCRRLGIEVVAVELNGVFWPLCLDGQDASWPLQPGHKYRVVLGGSSGTSLCPFFADKV